MNQVHGAIDIIGILVELMMFRYFFSITLEKQKYQYNIGVFIYFLVGCLLYIIAEIIIDPLLRTAICFMAICLLTLVYEGRVLLKLFLVAIVVAVYSAIEMLVATIIVITYSDGGVNSDYIMQFYIEGLLLSKFITLMLTRVLVSYRQSQSYNIPAKIILLITILPLTTVITIYALFDNAIRSDEVADFNRVIGISILLIITNIMLFYLFDKQTHLTQMKDKMLMTESLLKQQEEYYLKLIDNDLEVRKLSHDMTNRLLALSGLIKDCEYDEALNYLEKINIQLLEKRVVETGNSMIDAVVEAKMHEAKNLGIQLECNIHIAKDIVVDILDLAIVIGNCLDNSIEAVKKFDNQGLRWITITLARQGEYIVLNVKNPVIENIDIIDNSIMTSKVNKRYHGLGLINIKSLARKHAGDVFLSCKENVFTFNMMIVNKAVRAQERAVRESHTISS